MESAATVEGQEVVARYGDHTFHLGWKPVSEQQPAQAPQLAEHMAHIVAIVRAHGARPVVLTYPSDHRSLSPGQRCDCEAGPRSSMHRSSISTRSSKPLCAERDCQPLFFGDGHATEPGYREMAAMVAQWMQQQQSPDPGHENGDS